ncbi:MULTISPECIES: hypothetical protein [Streptomyces]|uniref:DUF4034 domain-containing protein n=1 Tax=Streptomyces venezuelae (strain ATCC 10712 / CBS 650.69 / DSM 40230 / JCM 4526 / NBRC 13096 / PD 04745) TaxID=953739 RepID=F2R711_STRVP|nr:hypothetical protein [Streptomyces venezuelae]APE19886.1 hypothetical protein vnz_01970 [Streptomyces venezuelae]QER97295.1 hypothetical protein DEJ43_01995 [Streptomyces venezuelae ATCC 10712]CCA53703.1 hypothetical protein SVEN_0416 [Streptomyces venezuelae ATCC 10712]
MAGHGFRPVYHPAGHDHALRNAVQDLRTGRWVAMARLLDETSDWDGWTRRTQVLAAVAAGTDVVHIWRTEQPGSLAATVMHSRVAVERAVRAHRAGHPRTRDLWHEAWTACREAADLAPDDPVPWVGLIALAALDGRQRMAEHRLAPPAPMLPPGPWGLLAEAEKRDPHNREAHHRMLQFVYARRPGPLSEAVNYSHWAASSAPVGSALHALPLYVRVERYRRERGQERALDLHWVAEDAVRDAQRALDTWFLFCATDEASVLDLNHLAHALFGALRFTDAARVFEALGPYYTTLPWAYRTPHPEDRVLAEEVFVRARARCLSG